MLKLIQVEFLKLRRRKFIWLMLLAALFMPLAAVFYFSSVKGTGVDPIMFYKWTAFSYTPWIILPVVLGMLCTMLMYNENQYDMLKQLWIVPVNKMAYFFSKFAVVLVYSICFMLVTATASILTGILSGYIPFDSESVLYLLRKCMEISLLTAFAVLPVLAVAAAQKGYILPVCLTPDLPQPGPHHPGLLRAQPGNGNPHRSGPEENVAGVKIAPNRKQNTTPRQGCRVLLS